MALDVLPEGFVERGVQGGRQGALRDEIPQEFLQHHLVQLPGLAGKLGIMRKGRSLSQNSHSSVFCVTRMEKAMKNQGMCCL